MTHKLILAVFLLLPHTGLTAEPEITRDDGSAVEYYLDNPDSDSLLVVFHGSDCNSVRHSNSIKQIWQTLQHDAALLTIEKYGIDESLAHKTGERDDCPADYLQHNSITQRVADAELVLQKIMKSDKYDFQNLVMTGGSEGGSVALAVAAKIPKLDAVIAINAGSASFQHDVEYSIGKTVPAEQLPDVLAGFRGFAEQIKTTDEPFAMTMSGHGYSFWKDALGRNLHAPLNHISAPVLIMQSANDESVDPVNTEHEIKTIIATGASNIELRMLPGLNHGFRDSAGDSQLEAVLEEAAQWLTNQPQIAPLP
ncbi:Prolyl oligopeptidase family protein [Pseudidiomarina planktonica]|uniref:Prolyl oligopeptidase family protein n=1 Tax=Pseudidiomarina planktonica TaxID=1323738 RepID=A0A1Y6ED97_9GAMM|nr:prolyl oligopeptidase family serine peptidase [Pseudidiomarina planktonica]RUO66316.1 alpha/beta hydrolase [Pseudidiomarina planktonica]SMQ58890.1 Prolyl oligopeptidase family protein [Pseudidiomarina planktonica]